MQRFLHDQNLLVDSEDTRETFCSGEDVEGVFLLSSKSKCTWVVEGFGSLVEEDWEVGNCRFSLKAS